MPVNYGRMRVGCTDTSDPGHFGTGAEMSGHFGTGAEVSLDVDVDVEDSRAQANASMPASYIAN